MKLICITGMGRSGTSLLCQILRALGVYFGERDDLILHTPINERGQFEHVRISQILEHCLRANGIDHWITPHSIRESWYSSPSAHHARQALSDQIAMLTERAQRSRSLAFAFKDARATLLLPLIERACAPREVVYLRCLRDPHAVSASVRNAGPSIPHRAMLGVWANYYMHAQEVSALDVWYEDWFSAHARADQIARVISYLGATDDVDADAITRALGEIDPKLRHAR